MNVWLHNQVLRHLSEHGAKIPRELHPRKRLVTTASRLAKRRKSMVAQ
jgi:hypothetical protein